MMLAQNVDLLQSIRTATNSGPDLTHMALLALGFLSLIGLIALSSRFLNRKQHPPPTPPHHCLNLAMDALELDREERQVLTRIAAAADLRASASLLLSPANFAHAVEQTLEKDNDGELRRRAARTCRRLFDVDLPKTLEADAPADSPAG